MGKDFPFDPKRSPEEFGEGAAGERVDKRNMRESHRDPSRKRLLRERGVEGGKNFDAAESVDKANSVIDRLVERGIIELRDPEDEEATGSSVGTTLTRLPDPEGDVKADVEKAKAADAVKSE